MGVLLLLAGCGGGAEVSDSSPDVASVDVEDASPQTSCDVPLASEGICLAICAHLCACGQVTEVEDCPAPCAIYASIASPSLAEGFQACVLSVPCEELSADTAVECILAGASPSAEGEALCALLEEHMSACLFTEGFRQTAGLFCRVHVTSHADRGAVEACVDAAMGEFPRGNFNPPPISTACADLEACVKDVLGLGMHPSWSD